MQHVQNPCITIILTTEIVISMSQNVKCDSFHSETSSTCHDLGETTTIS